MSVDSDESTRKRRSTLTTQAYRGATRAASYVWVWWHHRVAMPEGDGGSVERKKMESASAVSLKTEDVFSSGPAIGFRRTRHHSLLLDTVYLHTRIYVVLSGLRLLLHSSSCREDRHAQLHRIELCVIERAVPGNLRLNGSGSRERWYQPL
jgi:hypothetical protein